MTESCGLKSNKIRDNVTTPNIACADMHEINQTEAAANDNCVKFLTKFPLCCKTGMHPAYDEFEMEDKHSGATDRMCSGATPDVMIDWADENNKIVRQLHNAPTDKATREAMLTEMRRGWDATMAVNVLRAEGLQKIIRLRTEDQSKQCENKYGKKEEENVATENNSGDNKCPEDMVASQQDNKTPRRAAKPCDGEFCTLAAYLRCGVKRGVMLINKQSNCRKCNDFDKVKTANEMVERLLLNDDGALELITKIESLAESKRLFELGKIAAKIANDEQMWPMPIRKSRQQTTPLQRKLTRSLANTPCMQVLGTQAGPDGTTSAQDQEMMRTKAATTCGGNCLTATEGDNKPSKTKTCDNTRTCKWMSKFVC